MLAPPPRKTLKHLSRFGAPMVPVPIALNGHHTKNQHLIVSVAGIVGMCPLSCAMADFLSPAIVGMESFLQSAKSLKPRSCGLVDAGFCKDRLGSAIPATFVAGIADWKMWVVRVWEKLYKSVSMPYYAEDLRNASATLFGRLIKHTSVGYEPACNAPPCAWCATYGDPGMVEVWGRSIRLML